MDWTAFETDMKEATFAAFTRLAPLIEDEALYAFCLQTTDDGWGIGPFANTREGLVVQTEKLAALMTISPHTERTLAWSPDEWRYVGFAGDAFMKVNQQVMQVADGIPDADMPSHVEHITDAIIAALQQLRARHSDVLDRVTLFVTMSDSDDAEALENASSESLNPPDLHRAFLQRWADPAN